MSALRTSYSTNIFVKQAKSPTAQKQPHTLRKLPNQTTAHQKNTKNIGQSSSGSPSKYWRESPLAQCRSPLGLAWNRSNPPQLVAILLPSIPLDASLLMCISLKRKVLPTWAKSKQTTSSLLSRGWVEPPQELGCFLLVKFPAFLWTISQPE